jgi:hypothetical protein
MTLTSFMIALLGVWRLTHLLAAEDGPADAVVRLRSAVGNGFWGKLLDCFYCLSLWVAIPFALAIGASWPERLLLWPSLSGGAILVDRLTTRAPETPAENVEPGTHKEEGDVVLRR